LLLCAPSILLLSSSRGGTLVSRCQTPCYQTVPLRPEFRPPPLHVQAGFSRTLSFLDLTTVDAPLPLLPSLIPLPFDTLLLAFILTSPLGQARDRSRSKETPDVPPPPIVCSSSTDTHFLLFFFFLDKNDIRFWTIGPSSQVFSSPFCFSAGSPIRHVLLIENPNPPL